MHWRVCGTVCPVETLQPGGDGDILLGRGAAPLGRTDSFGKLSTITRLQRQDLLLLGPPALSVGAERRWEVIYLAKCWVTGIMPVTERQE